WSCRSLLGLRLAIQPMTEHTGSSDAVRTVGAGRVGTDGGAMGRPTAPRPRPIRWRRRRALERPGPEPPAGEEISPRAVAPTTPPPPESSLLRDPHPGLRPHRPRAGVRDHPARGRDGAGDRVRPVRRGA